MNVKPELAFDVCWEVYRGAREVLETKRGISALNWKDTGKFLWRPDFRPRLNEWVADFALPGQAALDGPDWASRMVLFRLYYLGLAPYENARHFLGPSEHSWVNWTERIRRRCGKELLSRGMFLPRKYFTSIDWANCRRDHQERWARHCGVLAEPSRSSHQLRQSTTIGFLTLLSHYVACPERRSGAQWPQPKGATMNAFKKLAAKYLFPS